jgi:type IV secretion system protein VirB10
MVSTEKAITSVNSRGGESSNTAQKVAFFVLVLAMLIVGIMVGVNTFTSAKKQEKQKEDNENRQAAASQGISRRQFASSDPVVSPPSPVEDWHYLMGADGKPVLGADGQPIRIGRDGKVLPSQFPIVPPLAGATMPTGEVGRSSSPPVSRYGGDVVVSSTPGNTLSSNPGLANTLNNPIDPTALVQNILKNTMAAGNESNSGTPQHQTAPATPPTQLEGMLTPTKTPMVTASKLESRTMLLPKGRSIDCVLTTKLVSELPGMTACIVSSNVYSDNGRVLLLERGSEATGEYGATTQQGQRRIFVVWDRIKTPNGVVINLNSPGTDSLGTTGLSGEVDNRWGERIGAAFLLSMVKDIVGYEVAKTSAQNGNGGSVYAFQSTTQTGNQMAEKVLESTINIKPVVYKNQGDRISIFVARDLDFRSVYALHAR